MPEPRAKLAAGAGLARRKSASALPLSASGLGQLSTLVPERLVEPLAWAGHSPFVMWLIERWQPQQIVELGVHSGNSFFAMCQAVKRAGLRCSLIGIDSWKEDPQAGLYYEDAYEAVKAHCDAKYRSFASLLRCHFDEALAKFADGSIDLLHIDGYHDYDAVRHDYQSWLPKMSGQGVILFHDTQVREPATFGVWRLWAEIKRYYPHCEFVHAHGLGVLFVGGELDKRREALRDSLCDPSGFEQVNSLFSTLGTAIVSERGASLRSHALVEDVRALTREVELRGVALARLHGVLETVRADRDQQSERARAAGELKATLAQVRAEHDGLAAKVAQVSAELDARDGARQQLQMQHDAMAQTLDDERAAVHAERETHKCELGALQAELESARGQIESRASALAHLHAVVAAVRAERDEAVEQSRIKHELLEHRLADANAELLARENHRVELCGQLERIVQHSADIQLMLERSNQELEMVRAHLTRREQALTDTRVELAQCDRQVAELLKVEQNLRLERRVSRALRSALDERWRERSELFTCRTWRLWQPVREVLTRIIRRRKNMSMRLAVADAWAALLGRPPLNPPPHRDPLLDVRQEHSGQLP